MTQPWNIHIHYDSLLDSLVPIEAQRVLDVGTGDGFLAARLAERVGTVIAVDIDGPVLERARRRFPAASVTWVNDDVMNAEFAPDAFDAVVSNAALHHLDDTQAALHRLASLLAPGVSDRPRTPLGCRQPNAELSPESSGRWLIDWASKSPRGTNDRRYPACQ